MPEPIRSASSRPSLGEGKQLDGRFFAEHGKQFKKESGDSVSFAGAERIVRSRSTTRTAGVFVPLMGARPERSGKNRLDIPSAEDIKWRDNGFGVKYAKGFGHTSGLFCSPAEKPGNA